MIAIAVWGWFALGGAAVCALIVLALSVSLTALKERLDFLLWEAGERLTLEVLGGIAFAAVVIALTVYGIFFASSKRECVAEDKFGQCIYTVERP